MIEAAYLYAEALHMDTLYYRESVARLNRSIDDVLDELSHADPYGLVESVRAARFRLNTALNSFDRRVEVKKYLVDFSAILCLYYEEELLAFFGRTYEGYSWQNSLLRVLGRDPEKENIFCLELAGDS